MIKKTTVKNEEKKELSANKGEFNKEVEKSKGKRRSEKFEGMDLEEVDMGTKRVESKVRPKIHLKQHRRRPSEFRNKVLPRLKKLYESKGDKEEEQAKDYSILLEGFKPDDIKKEMVHYLAQASLSPEKQALKKKRTLKLSPRRDVLAVSDGGLQLRKDKEETISRVSQKKIESGKDEIIIDIDYLAKEDSKESSSSTKEDIRKELESIKNTSPTLKALVDEEGVKRASLLSIKKPNMRRHSASRIKRKLDLGEEEKGLPINKFVHPLQVESRPIFFNSDEVRPEPLESVPATIASRKVSSPRYSIVPERSRGLYKPAKESQSDVEFFKFVLRMNKQHNEEQNAILLNLKAEHKETMQRLREDQDKALAYLKKQLELRKAEEVELRKELKELDKERDTLAETLSSLEGEKKGLDESELKQIEELGGKYLPNGGKNAFAIATGGLTAGTTLNGIIEENIGGNDGSSSSVGGSSSPKYWWIPYASGVAGFIVGLLMDICAKKKANVEGITNKLRVKDQMDEVLRKQILEEFTKQTNAKLNRRNRKSGSNMLFEDRDDRLIHLPDDL